MSLPGLLIEYLVTGATAFLWLMLLLHFPILGINLASFDLKALTLFVPIAYVLGMIIDFVSRVITWLLDFFLVEHLGWPILIKLTSQLASKSSGCRKLHQWVRSSAPGHPKPISPAQIMLSSTELGHQLEMRSSRDRIARGAFLNAIIGTVVLHAYYAAHPSLGVLPRDTLYLGIPSAVLLFSMWYRFEFLTLRYQVRAGEAILLQQRDHPTSPSASATSPSVHGEESPSARSD